MTVNANTWSADWQQRLRNRLHSLGCESVGEYLEKHPAAPYVAVAKGLGEDVAAMQLSRLQIQEVRDERAFRRVAMDSLAREITANLPNGWQQSSEPPKVAEAEPLWKHLSSKGSVLTEEDTRQRVEFQTSGAYAYWVVLLQKHDPQVEARATAVWNALKALSPPTDWLPKGPDDPLIVRAFDSGWAAPAKRRIKRQQYGLLCPNCKAVLSLPNGQANEIVCHHCGEQIELV